MSGTEPDESRRARLAYERLVLDCWPVGVVAREIDCPQADVRGWAIRGSAADHGAEAVVDRMLSPEMQAAACRRWEQRRAAGMT